jgi:hypothetical protein
VAVYITTGKLGNGKTLVSVGRIRDRLRAGCMVATNLDLDLSAMFGAFAKNLVVMRVPDKPGREHLEVIGCGNSSYDESKNGLLVLDECGTWLNSRAWQDKARQPLFDWLVHARKLGWDVILIVQDVSILDSQMREAIGEHVVYCRRLDRIQVPIIGALVKMLTGIRLALPRMHVAKVVYGLSTKDMVSDRWVYRGNDLFSCYDTRQAFLKDYPHGVHSMLTPWHRKGRFMVPRDWRFYMRMTKIVFRRVRVPIAFGVGMLTGVTALAGTAFADLYRRGIESERIDYQQAVQAAAAELVQSQQLHDADDSTLDELDGYRIVSHIAYGKSVRYVLEAPAVEEGGEPRRTTSAELVRAGYEVTGRSDCLLEVKLGDQVERVSCL